MKCKHCKARVGLATVLIYGGFCSSECKIASEDLKENANCKIVEKDDFEFPEVSMGSLKKSKENLEKGSEEDDANDLISGEELEQGASIVDVVEDMTDQYYEYCLLNDIDV